ncbi:hypothetical protein OUZ56_032196 [Daphnia magna]|uniref:Uncharacterized protein n=1 Tax=Daphnia magna TaxID=35525 RepID=A0ABQ9ZWH7_9CRUS|nr:hypothetical protein OUZ56_032196 [Daphnia magna]
MDLIRVLERRLLNCFLMHDGLKLSADEAVVLVKQRAEDFKALFEDCSPIVVGSSMVMEKNSLVPMLVLSGVCLALMLWLGGAKMLVYVNGGTGLSLLRGSGIEVHCHQM